MLWLSLSGGNVNVQLWSHSFPLFFFSHNIFNSTFFPQKKPMGFVRNSWPPGPNFPLFWAAGEAWTGKVWKLEPWSTISRNKKLSISYFQLDTWMFHQDDHKICSHQVLYNFTNLCLQITSTCPWYCRHCRMWYGWKISTQGGCCVFKNSKSLLQ